MITKSEPTPLRMAEHFEMNMQGTVTGRVWASDLNRSNTPKSDRMDIDDPLNSVAPTGSEEQHAVARNLLDDDACNVIRSVAVYGNIQGKLAEDSVPEQIPVQSHFRSAMLRGYISELLHPSGMTTHRVNQSGLHLLLQRKVADDKALRMLGV